MLSPVPLTAGCADPEAGPSLADDDDAVTTALIQACFGKHRLICAQMVCLWPRNTVCSYFMPRRGRTCCEGKREWCVKLGLTASKGSTPGAPLQDVAIVWLPLQAGKVAGANMSELVRVTRFLVEKCSCFCCSLRSCQAPTTVEPDDTTAPKHHMTGVSRMIKVRINAGVVDGLARHLGIFKLLFSREFETSS